jgi:hypothetical protein
LTRANQQNQLTWSGSFRILKDQRGLSRAARSRDQKDSSWTKALAFSQGHGAGASKNNFYCRKM